MKKYDCTNNGDAQAGSHPGVKIGVSNVNPSTSGKHEIFFKIRQYSLIWSANIWRSYVNVADGLLNFLSAINQMLVSVKSKYLLKIDLVPIYLPFLQT